MGIHAWHFLDYDQDSNRVTRECTKCGAKREVDAGQRTVAWNRSDAGGPPTSGGF
jgi:hypothetical protein